MQPFSTSHDDQRRTRGIRSEHVVKKTADSALNVVSALRRCRQPVPARVAVVDGRPVRVTTDRRGFTGGAVTRCAGPWRTSGNWWVDETQNVELRNQKSEIRNQKWNRDEWDVSLSDGAVYRVFRDRDADRWFIDAIVD
jgi:protein ImuB